jgi:hypothetical protein
MSPLWFGMVGFGCISYPFQAGKGGGHPSCYCRILPATIPESSNEGRPLSAQYESVVEAKSFAEPFIYVLTFLMGCEEVV